MRPDRMNGLACPVPGTRSKHVISSSTLLLQSLQSSSSSLSSSTSLPKHSSFSLSYHSSLSSSSSLSKSTYPFRLPVTVIVSILLLLHYHFAVISVVQCQFVELQTELGRIRGVRTRSGYNNPGISFLGVPYALQPIGDRRFKKPIPYPKWSPKTLVATKYKSCCPQLDMNGAPHGSEDCLHLNIFVPINNVDQNQFSLGGKRYPVMIYIQGESFENGDAALYGAENFLDWDVILVTFNYRLGALGFLSTGDEQAIGNWGLYDQLMVLRWVHDHIESFSGNPNSVTIFGQGAGASSAFLHLISPLSTGLFHRVIAQSGSPLCSWSIEPDPEDAARQIGLHAGCPVPHLDNSEMLRCLRKVSIGKLLAAQQKGKVFAEYPHRMIPVIEHNGPMSSRLIPAEPKVLINQANYRRVPLMMGYNRDETSFLYPLILNKQFIGDSGGLRNYLEEKLLPRFVRATILEGNTFSDSVNSNLIKFKSNRPQVERDIIHNILFKYFNFLNGKNYTDLASRFVNMSTDALYGSCIDETLRIYSTASSSNQFLTSTNLLLPFANVTYKYLFDYRGRNSMLDLILSGTHATRHRYNVPASFSSDFSRITNNAVCHGDELFYLFNLNFSSRRPNDNRDLVVQRRLLVLWTDFAKHGFAPSITSTELPYWPAYTISSPVTYQINDDPKPRVLDSYRESETHFWTRYLPSITSPSSSASIIQKPTENHNTHSLSNDRYPAASNGRDNHHYDYTSMAKVRTFAWAMLTLSVILLMLIIVLLGLLYHQRRRQTFSAKCAQQERRASARALARALARETRENNNTSITSTTAPSASTSGLY